MTASTKTKITVKMVQFLLSSEGWSQYKIAKEFAISSETISRIANGEYEKKTPGRKRKL
jgi:transcriptional regulator with XRE-family HTH domain